MAGAARVCEAGGAEGGKRRGDGGAAAAGTAEGACVERSERGGAGESGSQEPGALAADVSDRGREETGERIGLGQHVYADQEPGGVADSQVRSGAADCDGAAGDCRDVGGKAVCGVE